MDTSRTKKSNNRLDSYKNHGKGANELRRQRNQLTVSLRNVISKYFFPFM